MYTLHLDLKINFLPPMQEHGPGIVLTRAIKIPFPPHDGLILHSQAIDECSGPEGFMIKQVIWDIDREVFLARTELVDSGTPIGAIVYQIQNWLDRGWELGSYRDTYPETVKPPPRPRGRRRRRKTDWDELERMQENRLPRRPEWFMDEFRAWVRFHVDNYSEFWAFAMDQTGVVSPPCQYKRDGSENTAWNEWQTVLQGYGKLSDSDRQAWLRKVKRYPRWTTLLPA